MQVSSPRGNWDPDSIDKNNQKFHYLIIVILDIMVLTKIELTWDDFRCIKNIIKE